MRPLLRRRNVNRCRFAREIGFLIVTFTCCSLYVTYLLSTTPLNNRASTVEGVSWLQDGGGGYSATLQRSILSQLANSSFGPRRQEQKRPESRRETLGARMERLLKEIEEVALQPLRERPRIVVVKGQRSVITRDLPLYQWALQRHGFTVHAPPWYTPRLPPGKNGTKAKPVKNPSILDSDPDSWLILLCLAFTDGDAGLCLEKRDLPKLKDHQRVNRIVGIRNILWRKDSFCESMNEVRKIPTLMRQQFSPLCFVFPTQFQQFLDIAEALGYTSQWLLKTLAVGGRSGGPGSQLLDIFTAEGRSKLKSYSTRRAVVQQVIPNVLTVFGQPVSLRLYALVTSFAPFRAYLHSEGLVFYRYDHTRNFRKISGRTWLLSQFWEYVSKHHGPETVKHAVNSLHQVVLQTLLVAEAILLSQISSVPSIFGDNYKITRCQQCFQLLGFDVIFNTTFDPVVMEVNGQPNMQDGGREEAAVTRKLKRTVLNDMVSLLTATTSVYKEVAEALEETGENMGVMGLSCHISHDLCLSHDDLLFLLASRRETLNKGGFRQLYPALGAEMYRELIEELDQSIIAQSMLSPQALGSSTTGFREPTTHRTADIHALLVALERYYYRHLMDEDYSDPAAEQNRLWNALNITDASKSLKYEDENTKSTVPAEEKKLPCSEDSATMPYLAQFNTEPPLHLSPTFNPLVTEYSANVSHDQLLIRVWAYAQNCQSEVRLDDKYGPSRPTNYTLGIGFNRISFLVVDITHTEPWVINTYTLVVQRLPITHGEPPFNSANNHEVCSVVQECDFRVFPSEKCGLQREASLNWTTHLAHVASLPICNSGRAQGRWVLPCATCSDPKSCFWKEASWHPFSCRHIILSQGALSSCLHGKKLLFIGDSTNRGMMHYMMERLNGTLTEWDKTHDIRIYTNLNGGKTSVSFAYYPQFWLPTNQRPVFDKALFQLFQRFHPIQNTTDSILIVGGVHWLAAQHIHMLLRALSSLKLQGMKLIMKSLGAGFHQPVEGVHSLSLEEQQKLAIHNAVLTSLAEEYNIEVVDTFNITVPRFKDFLPGKCACHFHMVSEVAGSDNQPPVWRGGPSITVPNPRYHVEGPINALYTEILLSRICDSSIPNR